jgi:spermidine/putrescine-binding protein
MWSDTFRSLKQQGVPVRFMRPKEGILSWCCGLVLAKAATEVNAAYELIDAILAPATGVKWIERGSNHANRKTYELIDERTLAELGSARSVRASGGEHFSARLSAAGRIPADVRRNAGFQLIDAATRELGRLVHERQHGLDI